MLKHSAANGNIPALVAGRDHYEGRSAEKAA
jgi:hypothetical protein